MTDYRTYTTDCQEERSVPGFTVIFNCKFSLTVRRQIFIERFGSIVIISKQILAKCPQTCGFIHVCLTKQFQYTLFGKIICENPSFNHFSMRKQGFLTAGISSIFIDIKSSEIKVGKYQTQKSIKAKKARLKSSLKADDIFPSTTWHYVTCFSPLIWVMENFTKQQTASFVT